MKINSRQKIENLDKKYELLKKVNPNKDYEYEYLREALEIKENFINNLIKHFNLKKEEKGADTLIENTFQIKTEIYDTFCIRNTVIYDIKDIAQAFYLIKQLNKIRISCYLTYIKDNKNIRNENFYFNSNFNYHARYILNMWDIEAENNINKWTSKDFMDNKKQNNKKEKSVKMNDNNKINHNLVMDLLRSQGQKQIELYNFISNTMYQSFKISISDSHNIILELEKMGMIEIKKSYSGNTHDNYDRKIKQYDYMIVINE